ncbi:MAG: Prenyltransferase, beta subunit [Planctomycetaceae bacterium]|nr:Prenyltransferase, beta subunit [Planctomycetaceae bacterium]
MSQTPYLMELAQRLAEGLRSLPEERRERHRRFLLTRQMPDGGFAGREEGSDLYYTGFALRGLAILGGLEESDAARVAIYLRKQIRRSLTVIDLLSWLYSALVVQAACGEDVLQDIAENWSERLAEMLEAFRAQDGGYRKTEEGSASSMYHSFLVVLCYELIGRTVPHPKRLIQFVFDRQRDDGGFVEIAPMKRSGTNPTAAAAAILRILGALDASARDDVRAFLMEVRSPEGGFLANMRIPFADGLSTFTGMLTAQDLGLEGLLNSEQTTTFINGLEMPAGGFRGATWDEVADVEYSFYGLGVLGLLGKPEDKVSQAVRDTNET